MKKIPIKIITISLMLLLFSCEHKTHVVNTIHEDGSVTRKVTIESEDDDITPETYRVPIDSTWQIEHSFSVNEENDTTWTFVAEKHFENVDAINDAYRNDNGSNSMLNRSALFSKKFRWFTTIYRFSETIESLLSVSSPMSDFFSQEEMKFVFLPESIQEELINGSDSTYYQQMSDSLEETTELWVFLSLSREWVELFHDLAGGDPALKISREEMLSKEKQFVRFLKENENDVLSGNDQLDSAFIQLFGRDFFTAFETKIDSALTLLEEVIEPAFSTKKYNIEIRMPGRIIASSGYSISYPDEENKEGVVWGVDGVHFLSQPYIMWVESRVNNYILWGISALFILIVFLGFIRQSIRCNKSKILHWLT